MAAGGAVLDALAADDGAVYKDLEVVSAGLAAGLEAAAKRAGCPVYITRVGSMLGVFFVDADGDRVIDYDGATGCHTDRYTAFFGAMLDGGVMLVECFPNPVPPDMRVSTGRTGQETSNVQAQET